MRIALILITFTAGLTYFWLSTSQIELQPTNTIQQEQSSEISDKSVSEKILQPTLEISKSIFQKATQHIETLTQPSESAIDIKTASHFVTADQLLKLPQTLIQTEVKLESVPTETTSQSENNTSNTSSNLNNQQTNLTGSQAKPSDRQKIQTELPSLTTSLDSSTISVSPNTDLSDTDSPDTVKSFAVTTDSGLSATITSPVISSAINSSDNLNAQQIAATEIRLKELLDQPDSTQKQVFYLHAVRDADQQGLWGIIQYALIDTFAKGIQLPGEDGIVKADIPADADERLLDKRSSFLGHVLQDKVEETYVYNYTKGTLGQNPDLITPGQQLVIVTFSEDELIKIYNFFIAE